MSRLCWAILTGEYPPQPGGVSDYTHQLAQALAKAGDEVHVWGPACNAGPLPGGSDTAVRVHRLADHFGPRGLSQLSNDLRALNRPYRLLVQYAPHAYGYKAMNLFFCRWLTRQSAPLWMHYHEVAYPFEHGQRLRHRLLAITTHWMAKMSAQAANRIFVTTPAWRPLLEPHAGSTSITWLGVPSNLPVQATPAHVQRLREQIGRSGMLLGHFGTFGSSVARMLEEALPVILSREPHCAMLLVGRGGENFTRELLQRHRELEGRVTATGAVPAQEAADGLAACDLLVQPYPDGVTTRRGSLMAGLALGRAMVTTTGPLTEAFWRDENALALADSSEQMIAHCLRLLNDPAERAAMGSRAAQTYAQSFAVEHTTASLREPAEGEKA